MFAAFFEAFFLHAQGPILLATAAKCETETQTPEPWGATDAGGRRLAQLRESARSYYETVNQAHIGMRWNLLKDDLLQQSEPSDPSEAPSADATGLNPRNPCHCTVRYSVSPSRLSLSETAALALSILRRLHLKDGFFADAAQTRDLRINEAFRSLRERAEFQALLRDIGANQPESPGPNDDTRDKKNRSLP